MVKLDHRIGERPKGRVGTEDDQVGYGHQADDDDQGVDRHAPATRHGRQADATAGVHEQRGGDGYGTQRDRKRAIDPREVKARSVPRTSAPANAHAKRARWATPRSRAHGRARVARMRRAIAPEPPKADHAERLHHAAARREHADDEDRHRQRRDHKRDKEGESPGVGPGRDGIRKARRRDQGRRQDQREDGHVQGALNVLLLLTERRGQRRRAGQDQRRAQHQHEEPDRERHRESERSAERSPRARDGRRPCGLGRGCAALAPALAPEIAIAECRDPMRARNRGRSSTASARSEATRRTPAHWRTDADKEDAGSTLPP